tara:strand:- start:818 stop:1516 length:699 start_codon:yes stop_codon:yes gene_type:complete
MDRPLLDPMTRSRATRSTLPFEELISSIPGLDPGLWSAISAFGKGRKSTRVLFTGTQPGDGVTVAATAAALGLARHLRVTTAYVETDLERPAVKGYLGMPSTAGLSDLLDGESSFDEAVSDVPGCPDLIVLGAGRARRAIPGEFASDIAEGILGRIVSPSQFTIIDGPPIASHPQMLSLLRHVDAAVLVVRARTSMKSELARAKAVLDQARVPVIGSVLNRFKPDHPWVNPA